MNVFLKECEFFCRKYFDVFLMMMVGGVVVCIVIRFCMLCLQVLCEVVFEMVEDELFDDEYDQVDDVGDYGVYVEVWWQVGG